MGKVSHRLRRFKDCPVAIMQPHGCRQLAERAAADAFGVPSERPVSSSGHRRPAHLLSDALP